MIPSSVSSSTVAPGAAASSGECVAMMTCDPAATASPIRISRARQDRNESAASGSSSR